MSEQPQSSSRGVAFGIVAAITSFAAILLLHERPRDGVAGDRLLDLWLVTNQEMLSVAVRGGEDPAWVQPLRPGAVYNGIADVVRVIPPEFRELLPQGNVMVQTFQDQKSARIGFGDVLFVTRARVEFTSDERARLRPLLGIVDPGLIPVGEP